MENLLSTNVFDTKEDMIIVGTCLKNMQPKAYKCLEELSNNLYEVCLEETHMNMVVTKVIGILARKKVKKLIFATVDKSPHCIQLHYIIKEIENMMDTKNIIIESYVAVDDTLVKIPLDIISLSKNLNTLKDTLGK